MTYKFTKLTGVPVEVPGLSFTYGGLNPTSTIPGFEVLTVQGRELLSDEIDYSTTAERDGGIITAHSLPVRILTIQYRLTATTNEQCRDNFNKLNAFLRQGGKVDRAIVFSDEPNATFYGRYNTADEAPADRNTLVSSFTILCVDPYKYVTQEIKTGNPSVTMGNTIPYATKPTKVKITPAGAISKVVVTNNSTGKKIVLNGNFGANNIIEIKIPENTITVDGQNRMQDLDYIESDFHKFLISSGNVINVSPSMAIEVTVRSRWL